MPRSGSQASLDVLPVLRRREGRRMFLMAALIAGLTSGRYVAGHIAAAVLPGLKMFGRALEVRARPSDQGRVLPATCATSEGRSSSKDPA